MSEPQIILAGTRNELQHINEALQRHCGPSYKLELSQYRFRKLGSAVYDETSEEYNIILCLFHGERCVSSVTGRYNKPNNSMELLSKTEPGYEGLKFNLYLRTAFIYLMCFLRTPVKTIYSHSLNPISTYAMYKHYNASNPDLKKYVREHNLTPATFTLEDAIHFHTYFTEKRNTPKRAEKELKEMLKEYSMEDLGWETKKDAITFIMTTMNMVAITLQLDLETPGIKEFLLNKLLSMQIKCETPSIFQDMKLGTTNARGGGGRTTRRKSRRKKSRKAKG